jgi:hypothetical protein
VTLVAELAQSKVGLDPQFQISVSAGDGSWSWMAWIWKDRSVGLHTYRSLVRQQVSETFSVLFLAYVLYQLLDFL